MARSDSETHEYEFTVSNRTILRIIGAAILAVVFYGAIRHSIHTLTLIGVALFLSLALDAPVRGLANRLPGRVKGSRGLATGISIGVVFILFAALVWLVAPPLVHQTGLFIREAPSLVNQVRDQNSGLGRIVREHHLQGEVNKLSEQLSNRVNDLGGTAVTTITYVGSSLFSVLAVLVLTVMMLAEGPRWGRLLGQLIPRRHSKHSEQLFQDMQRVIRGYVNGQVLLAAIASILIMPMLFILHISSPLALVFIIFICGLIPMVGHTIGAVIVTSVALFNSVTSAVVILAYYILYQQIENYVIQPRIQANATNMSALLVFIAVLLGANFGGLLGALVAIPVAGCLRVLVLDYLESRDILSRKTVELEKSPSKDGHF